MTTDELNAIVQAVMLELEKAGVDFDFKAETPQADDLVYVIRGTQDKYQGITVKWQNLLDIIVKKATDAKNEAVSAKDIALQTLATIQGIENNVSSMKSSVDASEANVASMKASVETSESNVTQMKSDVSAMKASVEGTKTEVENIKEETAGLLGTKVNYSDSLTYEHIMASTDLTNKVASASALKELGGTDWVQVSQYIRCKKIGNVKFAQIKTIDGVQQTWVNIGTLPQEYWPLDDVKCLFSTGSNLNYFGTCQIRTNGLVREWCHNFNPIESGEYNVNIIYM